MLVFGSKANPSSCIYGQAHGVLAWSGQTTALRPRESLPDRRYRFTTLPVAHGDPIAASSFLSSLLGHLQVRHCISVSVLVLPAYHLSSHLYNKLRSGTAATGSTSNSLLKARTALLRHIGSRLSLEYRRNWQHRPKQVEGFPRGTRLPVALEASNRKTLGHNHLEAEARCDIDKNGRRRFQSDRTPPSARAPFSPWPPLSRFRSALRPS